MITGACPHEGDSLRDVVMAKLRGAPRITINPGKEILPQELTDVVDACLQLKPALRPKDAKQLVRALSEAEAVLFVVGPVKADGGGAFSRPNSRSMPPVQAPEPQPPQAPPPPEPPPEAPIHTTEQIPQSAIVTEPSVALPEAYLKRARLFALLALAIAVLAVASVLFMHMEDDEPMLLVPLEHNPQGV